MKNLKRILLFLLLLFLLNSNLITTSFAAANVNNLDTATSNQQQTAKAASLKIYSPSCILIEVNTGKILYEKNSNEIRYPASTTKIMTAILTLENCKLTDVATVSHNAAYSLPSDYVRANLQEGEKLTIEQLLHVLLIPSANDAAIVLAEHISGSVDKFANLMNEKAKEIGCKNTHFVNPNGMHNKNHVTTAYDLSLMGKYAMQNNTFRSIVKKTKCSLPATNKYASTNRSFNTTNELLKKNNKRYYSPDVIGIKTGYTEDAGSCLVAEAKRDDLEFIAVVLGGETTNTGLSERALDCNTLFDYAFDNYSIKTVKKKDSVLQNIEVSGATKETKNLEVLVKDDIKIFLNNDTSCESLTSDISLDKLKAPITAGSVVGKITYTVDGETYSSDLIAKNDVVASELLSTLFKIALVLVFLYIIYAAFGARTKKHSKHKRKTKRER